MSETFEVYDKRDQPFYIVDDVFLKRFGKVIGPNGIAVYNALCMHSNKKTGESWPSRESIHEVTGLSVRAISTAIKQLASLKLIKIASTTGGPNHYFIQPVPEKAEPMHHVQAPPLAPRARGVARPASPPAPTATPLAPRASEQEPLTIIKNNNQEQEGKAAKAAAQPKAAPPAPINPPVEEKGKPTRTTKTGKAAVKETPEETAYYRACVPVIAQACNYDLGVNGVWAQCKKPLQALYHAEVRPTPELIEREFIATDGYWRQDHWKGKKGEYPEPHEFPNNWKRAMTWRDKPALAIVGGNGNRSRGTPGANGDPSIDYLAIALEQETRRTSSRTVEGRFVNG